MLHLKSHHFSLPRFSPPSQKLALSPVSTEEDELIQAIESSHEEQWELEPTPDARQLDQFWSGVEQDLKQDPTWFSFAEDEED